MQKKMQKSKKMQKKAKKNAKIFGGVSLVGGLLHRGSPCQGVLLGSWGVSLAVGGVSLAVGGKECRSIVRDESSVYFNVTAVNRYDI